jgi:hypothetical protein
VQEVGRAIERIDDPHVVRVRVLVAARAFLGKDRVVRVRGVQRLHDRGLRRVVDLAHEILRSLRGDRQKVEIARAAVDDVAGAARGLHRVVSIGCMKALF